MSYLGGLFSAVTAALFLICKYNKYAYEIELAARVYTQ